MWLAIAEIAVAVMLVTGAGLLLRTVVALDRVDPGYPADRVLTMYTTDITGTDIFIQCATHGVHDFAIRRMAGREAARTRQHGHRLSG